VRATVLRQTRKLPMASVALVLAISSCLILIWLLFPELKAFSARTMKMNTAVGLALGSIALWLLKVEPSFGSSRRRRIGQGIAAFIVLLGGLTLLQYATGWSLGIDESLVDDFRDVESSRFPGRMSPIAATYFVLLGGALLTLDLTFKLRRRFHPATWLLAPILLSSLTAVVGYLYDVESFYQIGPYIRIAWLSAICFSLLALGILFARPNRKPIRILIVPGLGGIVARRLLLATLVIPICLGWLRLYGQRHGYFDLVMGTALLVVALVVIFGALILSSAQRLDELETSEALRRKKSEDDRESLLSTLRETVEVQKKIQAQLSRTIQARDEFMSIASHELRTPLTALKMQTELLARGLEKKDSASVMPERIRRYVDQIDRQTTRIVRLVDDMLDVARIQTGRLRIKKERINLSEVLQEVVERFRPQLVAAAEGRAPTLKVGRACFGDWDRLRIEQVIANLMTNAIRYGNKQPIEIRLEQDGAYATLSVKDRGIGVAPEHRERIFDRFERAVSANEVSGLGLGLFISRQIVEAHGGRIWAESEPGQGATFYVELPLPRSIENHVRA
jgi:signal transduction histidine kinase